MGRLTLSSLFFYPVKSLAGVALERADLGVRGLAFDRHWMVVDSRGEFMSQRTQPRMALVRPALTAYRLQLTAPDMPPLEIPGETDGERCRVRVWETACNARSEGDEAARWLSEFLGTDCRLVRFDEGERRRVDKRYGRAADEIAFADGFPLLVLSEASLNDLNRQLERPVSVERFRPNLVIRGCGPYAEDSWRRLRVGATSIRLVKPCTRCTIPGVDPATGMTSEEPLKTLARYRRREEGVTFGMNAVADETGELKTGMMVELLA